MMARALFNIHMEEEGDLEFMAGDLIEVPITAQQSPQCLSSARLARTAWTVQTAARSHRRCLMCAA